MKTRQLAVAAGLLVLSVLAASMEDFDEEEEGDWYFYEEGDWYFDVDDDAAWEELGVTDEFDAFWEMDDWETALSPADEYGNSLKFELEVVDETGDKHRRVQQFYDGLPIWGGTVINHLKADGTKKYTGNWFKDVKTDLGDITATDYTAGEDLMLQIKADTLALYPGESFEDLKFSDLHYEAIVYQDERDKKKKPFVAYYGHFFVESRLTGSPRRPHYIVKAADKSVIKHWEGLADAAGSPLATGPGGNTETKQHTYGSDLGKLIVTQNGDTCIFENDNVKTINMAGATSDEVTAAFSFTCPNHAADAVNGAFSPLNDAHYYGNVVFDMYKQWFNTKPLLNQLVLRVHYGTQYENAYWNGKTVTIGDGKDRFYPLVSLDVVSHEISHAVTEQNAKLVYREQAGAVNEAFADMAGKAAEFFLYGKVKNWGVGQDITKSDKPIRYMDNPAADGVSIDHAGKYKADMNVHHSSGVFNKAFHYMATASGWDVKKAFQLVFCANRNYWITTTNFQQAAQGVLNCARDQAVDQAVVKAAFATVGITLEAPTSGGTGTGGLTASQGGETQTIVEECFERLNETEAEMEVYYFDDDGDNQISTAENELMATSCEADASGCAAFQRTWFTLVDLNKDGFVTAVEIVEAEGSWDKDDDGWVCDPGEIPEGLSFYQKYQAVYRRY